MLDIFDWEEFYKVLIIGAIVLLAIVFVVVVICACCQFAMWKILLALLIFGIGTIVIAIGQGYDIFY